MNAANTPEFKRILRGVYDSHKFKTSGQVLSEAWKIYRSRHGSTMSSVPGGRAYSRRHVNPRYPCECSDPGCPVHKGKSKCGKLASTKVYRSDMEDQSGTPMCRDCASDAMDSGVFYQKNPKEMRPRVTVTKTTRRAKLRKRSPLKGYRINARVSRSTLDGKLNLINRELNESFRFEKYLGQLRVVNQKGSRDISPRLPPKQMELWLSAFVEAIFWCKGHYKSNPIAVYNPKRGRGVRLPMALTEMCYKRTGGRYSGQYFKHHFKERPVVTGLADGSLLIKGRQRLWGE